KALCSIFVRPERTRLFTCDSGAIAFDCLANFGESFQAVLLNAILGGRIAIEHRAVASEILVIPFRDCPLMLVLSDGRGCIPGLSPSGGSGDKSLLHLDKEVGQPPPR